MATKDEMEMDIQLTFEVYEHLFKECGISRLTFLKWLESCAQSHELTRKANRFMHGKLMQYLKALNIVWKHHPAHAWQGLKLVSKYSHDVKILNAAKSDVVYQWSVRPKPSRRK